MIVRLVLVADIVYARGQVGNVRIGDIAPI